MKQIRHSKTNFRMLLPFVNGMDGEHSHRRFTASEYMPLVIEYLHYSDCKGFPVFSICHYGEQNGDAMRDPEMTVSIDFESGAIEPQTFQNDYLGVYQEVYRECNGVYQYRPRLRSELDDFLWHWLQNIREQGFSPIGGGQRDV